MNIILKHTLISMRKNRAQIALIIATVTVVVSMLFASFSMFDIFFNINAAEFTRLAADADMIVGAHYDGEFYSSNELNDLLSPYADKIEYKKHFIKMRGVLRTEKDNIGVLIEATDLAEYLKNTTLYGKYREGGLAYPSIVINQRFAGENNLGLGDTVELFLGTAEGYKKFSVYAISQNTGIFASGAAINVLIDLNDAEGQGLINVTLLKFKDKAVYVQVEELLNERMPNISVGEALNTTRNRQIALNNTLLFGVALLFIAGMMSLILVTSYMIIVKSRLNEMIIFKTAGATPLQTTLIMLSEALMYAVAGSLCGLIVGRGGMALAESALLKNFSAAITYEWWKWLLAFAGGIICALASALVPIIRLSRKSIREATSGTVKEVRNIKPVYLIILLAVMGIVIYAMRSLSTFYVLVLCAPLIALIALFIFAGSPNVHLWVSKIAEKIFQKGVFRLSSVTTRRNGAVHNVSVLLSTVIAFSFMVVAVIDFVNVMLTPSNARYVSDFVVEYQSGDKLPSRADLLRLESGLAGVEGIEGAYLVASSGIELKDESGKYADDDRWLQLVGLSDLSRLDYIFADPGNIVYKLPPSGAEHPAICNIDLIKRFGLKAGDELRFLIRNEEGEVIREYGQSVTIVGIDYTATEYDKYVYTDLGALYDNEESLAIGVRYFVNAGQGEEAFRVCAAFWSRTGSLGDALLFSVMSGGCTLPPWGWAM